MRTSNGAADPLPAITIEQVSPQTAQTWLGRNHPENRRIAWARVDAMANDMRGGNWRLTHQAVAFDSERRLIDGQHRLHAVVRSGVTVEMTVSRGIGSFGDPIDCGRGRSLALLSGRPTRIVAALNVLRQLEQGCMLNTPMTLAESEEICAHHYVSLEAVRAAADVSRLPAGILAALVYAHPCAPSVVEGFTARVVDGQMIARGSPAYALRSWRERASRMNGWEMAMAGLNATRYALDGGSLAAVFTTPMGYRVISSRRRSLKVPHTPVAALVPGDSGGSGVDWSERDR